MSEEIAEKDFLYGKPLTEEDEPITEIVQNTDVVVQQQIDPERYYNEKDKDRAEKRYFKSFNLIIICIGLLAFLYVFDSIFFAVTGKKTENFNGVLEAVKALLFSVSGYLFAEHHENKE